METMSQFSSEKDMWKAIALRLAQALVDFMAPTPDHDIQAETGLPNDDCERIAQAREDAMILLGIAKEPVDGKVKASG